jgi:hypothetical protein
MPEQQAVGIKELTELLDLAIEGVNAGLVISKDPTNLVNDMAQVMKLIPLIKPAIEQIGFIPSELADLTEEEAAAVTSHVVTKLQVGDAKAKKIIVASFKLISAGVAMIEAVKS